MKLKSVKDINQDNYDEVKLLLKSCINHALDRTKSFDSQLFKLQVAERTITSRISFYLQDEITRNFRKSKPIWKVDVEYNRILDHESKVLPSDIFDKVKEITAEDFYQELEKLENEGISGKNLYKYLTEKGVTVSHVYPDIIVHIRGKEENLAIIEVKKKSHSEKRKEKDRDKLKKFKEHLKYKFSYFIELDMENKGYKIEET